MLCRSVANSNSYIYDEKTTLLEHFKFLPSEKIVLPLDKFEKLLRFYRIFIVLLCNCSDEFKEISLSRLFDKSVWEEVFKKNDSENAEERKYFFTPIEYSKFSGNFEVNELLINQILNLHDESIINFETSKSNVKEKEKNIFDYIKQSLEKEFEALLTFSTTQIDDVENVSNLDFYI